MGLQRCDRELAQLPAGTGMNSRPGFIFGVIPGSVSASSTGLEAAAACSAPSLPSPEARCDLALYLGASLGIAAA